MSRDPHDPAPESIPAVGFDGLVNLYNEFSAALAQLKLSCDACGKCCHFEKWGHQLWVTELELRYLVARSGARTPMDEGVCPYLDDQGKCTARESRSLGCRAYFCTAPAGEVEALFERFFTRLTRLASDQEIELNYDELLSGLGQFLGQKGAR